MKNTDLSILFDIIMDKWATFIGSMDIIIIIYIINEIIKSDSHILRKTLKDIAEGSHTSFPSVYKCLEKATCFEILEVRQDESISRIQFGKKLRLQLIKLGIKR